MCFWVFGFLLIEISSRKAVPEVTSTFPGPLHNSVHGMDGRLGTVYAVAVEI